LSKRNIAKPPPPTFDPKKLMGLAVNYLFDPCDCVYGKFFEELAEQLIGEVPCLKGKRKKR